MIANVFKRAFLSFKSVQFLKFLIAGSIAALVNFFSRFFFDVFLTYVTSVIFAYLLGSIVSFILNKYFIFKVNDEKTSIQLFKFSILAVGAILLASIVVYLLMELYRLFPVSIVSEKTTESLAHILSIGVTTIYNFLAMKFFSFRNLGNC